MIYQKHLQAQEWGNKLNQELETSTCKHRHEKSRRNKRDFFSNAWNTVKNTAEKTVNTIGDGAKKVGQTVCQGAKTAVDFDSSVRQRIQGKTVESLESGKLGKTGVVFAPIADEIKGAWDKVDKVKKNILNKLC